jgi:hypothetical protein
MTNHGENVLALALEVLALFPQKGRSFIGAPRCGMILKLAGSQHGAES